MTNQKRLKGESSVNVTVLKIPRINTPPVADVDPLRQTITLPTNQAIIDASGLFSLLLLFYVVCLTIFYLNLEYNY